MIGHNPRIKQEEEANTKKQAALNIAVFGPPAVFIVAILIYATLTFSLESAPITTTGLSRFDAAWSQRIGVGYNTVKSLPAELPCVNNTIVITNTLPRQIDRDAVLVIKTQYQRLRVSIDGEEIYEIGFKDEASFGLGFGFLWNFIPISEQYAGKTIALEFLSPVSVTSMPVDSILFGNEVAAFVTVFKQNAPIVFLCFLMFVVSGLFLIFSVMMHKRFPRIKWSSSIYLGLFFLLTTLWLITDCDMLQFFIGDRTFFYLMSFFAFMTLPIPFLLFVNELCVRRRKSIFIMCCVYSANILICCLLYVLNIKDLIQTIITTHILLFTSFSLVAYICAQEIKLKNNEIRGLACGIAFLILFSFISLFVYYHTKSDYTLFSGLGLVIFTGFISISGSKKYFSLMNASITAENYKLLAYTDSLTGLGNRTAFSEAIDSTHMNIAAYSSVAIVVFDMDNLKPINDSLGHMTGDELIKGVSNCISTAFSGKGQSFRTGGDEFAVILTDITTEELRERLEALNFCVETYNKNHLHGIALSIGFEFCDIGKPAILSVYDILNRADAKMYEHKKSKDLLCNE